MSRTARSLLVIMVLAFSALFGAEWLAMPAELPSEVPATVVSASFLPGKGGKAQLRGADGLIAAVRCARLEALCNVIRERPRDGIAVRLARVGLFGDTWPVSVRIDGHEMLSLAEVKERYAVSRAMHAALSLILLLFGAALWRYLPASALPK